MLDRQVFQESRLANGLQVYWYPHEVPYTRVMLRVPFGSSHNGEDIRPGTFHFLEHMLTLRSKLYPAYKEFDRLVASKSGSFNAWTSRFATTYDFCVPTKYLAELLPGFFSQLFEPVFLEEDAVLERTVIESERELGRLWYPGDSELSQYLATEWVFDAPLSLRQRLGENDDLAAVGVAELQAAHAFYLTRGLQVIAGGSGDISAFLNSLETLPLAQVSRPEVFEAPRWVRPEYHIKAFRESSRFELHYSGIVATTPNPQELRAQRFILHYLCNESTGALYQWLRDETGWAYDLQWYCDGDSRGYQWSIVFPLGSLEEADSVRQELEQRIAAALADSEQVAIEVQSWRDSAETYWYQTLSDILGDAETDIDTYGRILSEKEVLGMIERCCDSAYLAEVWARHTQPELTGWICAVPEGH
jgi:predicted Zn-dependent peptidase